MYENLNSSKFFDILEDTNRTKYGKLVGAKAGRWDTRVTTTEGGRQKVVLGG